MIVTNRVRHALLRPALILCLLSATPVGLPADEEEDLQPGLVGRYSSGDAAIARIDPDVQFTWRSGVPDRRMPDGEFSVDWRGQLLVRTEGEYRFHLFLQGAAHVSIAGQEAVRGSAGIPRWIAGRAIGLAPGEHTLEVSFRKTAEEAVIRIFWESAALLLEPIPSRDLFHARTPPGLALIERGGDLYVAHRCNRCHVRQNDAPSLAAAPLAHAAQAQSRENLAAWVRSPPEVSRHAKMPGFGFSQDESRAVAEFLASQAAPFDEPFPRPADEQAASRRGELLFRSVGCLACHTQGELGNASLFGGGDLTRIGDRRDAAWLHVWLKEPERLNPLHRMPTFRLTDEERADLAIYLAGSPPAPASEKSDRRALRASFDSALVGRGRQLIVQSRCQACHHEPDQAPDFKGVPPLDQSVADWARACSEAAPDRASGRPGYRFGDADRAALREYVTAHHGSLSMESAHEIARRRLRHDNCLACHARDGDQGISGVALGAARADAELEGQTEALLPPDLTAVGDKLLDSFLTQAVVGAQDGPRLPWLRVRMPRFRDDPPLTAERVRYFMDHDRIPDPDPAVPEVVRFAPRAAGEPEVLRAAGRVLAGMRGFSCVACHRVGKHEPRNVALATRGSDLHGLSRRMRPEFFARWVHSPLAVVPNMEMPSYDKPHSGLLHDDLSQQLAALWEALNDPQGPPQLDTSRIEQTLIVGPDDSPKVIRDVFHIGDPLRPEPVPRGLAIGFANGVNVLFDLALSQVRHWWLGDFAQQRASGKSWSWGPPSSTGSGPARTSPDIVLRRVGAEHDPPIVARRTSGQFGRLRRYVTGKRHVSLEYDLTFQFNDREITLQVTELFAPATIHDGPKSDAFRRSVTIRGVPEGLDAILLNPTQQGNERESLMPLLHDRISQRAWTMITYGGSRLQDYRGAIEPPPAPATAEPITCVPGYDGVRLPLPGSIMPTAVTWTKEGTLAFCSLKGQVYLAQDTDGDGLEDTLTVFEEGLAAPYGLIADGGDLIVAHKPELLRLRDTDGDGRADIREVVADGWGYTDDYHDWTTGIVRDSQGNLYIGTGSDYARPGRDREKARWRGKVLRIAPSGEVTPLGHAFRYPTGLAINSEDQVFVTDNQGVQNTYNEINHLIAGAHYGVPSLYEEPHEGSPRAPSIHVPHPWTRSVNGIFFLPSPAERREGGKREGERERGGDLKTGGGSRFLEPVFAGHGIGCEYDSRFLVRFTLQRVGDTFQGAVYPFSRPPGSERAGQFRGTLCGGVAPKGDIYIGSFLDSGWLGGPNMGDLVRLRRRGPLPVGIREIRAADGRFIVTFTAPIDRDAATRPENYSIAGARRVWQGAYATPDSGRHTLPVRRADVAADALSATLHVDGQQAGCVYEVNCGKIGPDHETPLWPATGYYTLHHLPPRADADALRSLP